MRYIKIIENKPYYYSVDMPHRNSNYYVIYKSDPWHGRLYGKSELFNILVLEDILGLRKNCYLYLSKHSEIELKAFNLLRSVIL